MTALPTPRPDRNCVLLHDLILERYRLAPDAVAVVLSGQQVTYRDLLDRARAVAADLAERGAGPETRVGVAADRSVDALIAILGTLLAGAAYVPFAHDLPAERIRQIAKDAGLKVIVGSAAALGCLSGQSEHLLAVTGRRREPVPTAVRPDHTAYVIFTSGSAGRPKGVITPHRQIVSSTLARFAVFPHREGMTYLMLAPFTFDAAAAGIYFTLCAGGRLIVPTAAEVVDSALIAGLIGRYGVTHLDGVPSQYAALVNFHPQSLARLECTVLAGEALPAALARGHFAAAPDTALFNEYGPTEGTVWSAVHRCAPEDEGPLMPIGSAIPGVRIALLDGDLRPVGDGETGEICISGAGVARGYLNQPRLTAERFVPDPSGAVPGGRMYCTGDLGRVNAKGEIVFRERIDSQVKVRGFRVEISEVEARILAHPRIAATAVVPRQTSTGTRLAAFLVARNGCAPSAADLRAFVGEHLPDYMVPTSWQVLPAMPLNAHGKLDRAELAATVAKATTDHPFTNH